jgi:enoyl-CoA hydratase/carnithine racemase
MDHKATRYAVDAGIATITLHRPERMNAWTGRMHTEYRYCLDLAERDEVVRAIVVTGAGRGFCVGGDAEALRGHVEKGGYDPGTPAALARPGFGIAPEFDASFAFHFGLSKPVVAAINGPAAGVGLALACFADLRFAAAGIKMTTAHGKLNLPAEYGLSWLLPRMIGLTRANELLLTSRAFLAEEALAFGLINGVHPAETLLAETYAFTRNLIATVSPNSLRQTRWQVYRDLHRDVAESVRDSESLLNTMMREPDYAEGVAAFLEKRSPKWRGPNS